MAPSAFYFPIDGTQQGYRYYAGSDRTAFTYIGGTASIDYVYTRAQLTDLIRKAFPQAADASGNNVNPFWQHYLLGYDAFGNMTSAQVCASSAEREGYTAPVTLALYTYEGNVNNGRLSRMTYGNGDSVSYTYDAFDRQRTAAYNDGTTYHYDYSSDNALTRQYATDGSGITEQYSYQYDSLGRLIHSRQSTADGALIQVTQHMYDDANRMTSQTWQFGTGLYHQQYSYTGVKADGATDSSVDGTISAITTTVPGRSAITSKYEYNDLRQLEKKTVTVPDQNGKQTKVYDRSYTYDRIAADDGCNRMGTRLASTGYTFGSSSRGFTYTYDAAGNISRIVTAGTSVPKAAQLKEYTYDTQGQLATEKNGSGTTFLYAYDTAGNIRSITKDGAVTKSFGYTNPSWPDLLTSVTANGTTKDVLYEGQSQTSDLPSSGNPVTYYNGKDYAFTWTKGRQLAKAVVDGKTVEYTYDMSGVRTSKTVNGTTYNYTTLSGKVMRQQWDGKTLEFVYDDGSQPFAMIYKHGQTTELYYYVLNAQGDVIALLNSAGSLVASYNYGAWGNYSVHGADGKKTTDPTFIGHINPLRYRGYYYDRETRLYYLQSRYYDFANCRFINADTFATTDANGFLSANMFAYCENNPIMLVDQDGGVPVIIAGALIGGLVGAISGALSSALQGGDKSEIMAGALSGMVTGFVAGVVSTAAPILAAALDVSGVAMLGATSAVSGAVGTLSSALSQKSTKGKVDWGEAVLNGGLTAIDTFASRGVGIIARGSGIGTAVCTTVQATANLTFGSMLGQIQGAFKTTFGSGRSRRRAPRKRVIRHSRYRARWRSRYRF